MQGCSGPEKVLMDLNLDRYFTMLNAGAAGILLSSDREVACLIELGSTPMSTIV